LPGPVLVEQPNVLAQLISAFDPVVDRLSPSTYLLLPRDQLRVVFEVVQPSPVGEAIVRIQAFPPVGSPAGVRYRFVLLARSGETILRDFSDDPRFEVPLTRTLDGGIRVELQEPGQSNVRARLRLDYRQFLYH
jgi:hypothetical protein